MMKQVLLIVAAVVCVINAGITRRDRRITEPPCPADWKISPCVCTGRPSAPDMNCSAVTDGVELKKIFEAKKEGVNFRGIEIHESKIDSLPENVFGTHNFYLFFLNDNGIKTISPNAFKGSEESAEMIRLGNNKISQFTFDTLSSLKNLRVLDLSQNQISEIPEKAFPKLENIVMLNFSSNRINSIGPNAFSGLDGLQKVDLSSNQLSSEKLSEMAFRGLTVTNIDLTGNQLQTLNQELFSTLVKVGTVVELKGNPIQCNHENMKWINDLPRQSKSLLKDISC